MTQPCPRCGTPAAFLVKLHGERGGPELCMPCGTEILGIADGKQKRGQELFDALFGGMAAAPNEVSRGLIDDVLRLTHPDLHTPSRRDLATSVTAELTALRKHAKARPAPPKPASASASTTAPRPIKVAEYPCETCRHLWPGVYCDRCANRWRKEQRAEKDRENARRRERRAAQRGERECAACERRFAPRRADARYCSPSCRQRAYRNRRELAAELRKAAGE